MGNARRNKRLGVQHQLVLLMIILILQPLVLAQDYAGDYITCETTDTSAREDDAIAGIANLKALGTTNCCHNECWGNVCTQMQAIGTAVLSVCGDNHCSCRPCADVAQLLTNVKETCVQTVQGYRKIGGYYTDPSGVGFYMITPVVT